MTRFRVTVFGALDIRDPGGLSLDSVLAQPKRAALLVYLFASTPRGFRRRDSLRALFWPELDERRARDALNSAVYFLRKALGDGVIVARGSDELGVQSDLLSCDLVEFDAAIASGNPQQALELSRSELLDGFVVGDAPAFDDWLSRERTRVREASTNAALALASAASSAGDAGGALGWAERAHALAPDDEAVVRQLMETHERAGDSARALRVYHAFREHLRRTYELEPSPPTVTLAESIRERTRQPEVGPPKRVPPADVAAALVHAMQRESPDRVPPPAQPASLAGPVHEPAAPVRSGKRRDAVGALSLSVVGILLVGAMATAAMTRGFSRFTGSADVESRSVLAVFPFAVHGAQSDEPLGEGMARLIATTLDEVGDSRLVDTRALLGATPAQNNAGERGAMDERLRAVAASLRASLFVSGDIEATADSLDVRALLHESSSRKVLARAHARVARGDYFAVVDQVALQLIAGLPGQSGAAFEGLAARTTNSLPALRLYLTGEHEFQRGRFAEAIEAFRGAVSADSTFAVALYRLSNALTWSRLPPGLPPDSLADAAVRHGTNVPERDRILFRAWRSYLRGDAVDAEQRYREVLSTRPADVEASFYLGEVLFHWGPVFGRPALEARAPFEQVLRFEADNVGALSHLVRLAATAGDTARVTEYAARLLRLGPDSAEVSEVRGLEAFATRDTVAMRAFFDNLPRLSSRDARGVVWAIAVHTRDAEVLARLLARLELPPFDPFLRRQAHLVHAAHLMAIGQANAAMSTLEPNDVLTPARSLEYRTMLATLPFAPGPVTRLKELEQGILGTPPMDLSVGPGQYSLPSGSIYPPRRLYLLGLLRLRMGDTAAVARYADSLLTLSWANNRNQLFSRSFGRLLRAELLRHAKQPVEALAALGLPGVEEDSNLTELTSYPKAHERFLRGELLSELGRDAEAARWFETFPDLQLTDLMYRTTAELRLAELSEKRGDKGAALTGFFAVLRNLAKADTSFSPQVRRAEAGRRRVASRSG